VQAKWWIVIRDTVSEAARLGKAVKRVLTFAVRPLDRGAVFYGLKCAVLAGLDGAVVGRADDGVFIPVETWRVEVAMITAAAGA